MSGEWQTIDTDLLVIGGGVAGSMAAIPALEAGMSVTICEKGRLLDNCGSVGCGVKSDDKVITYCRMSHRSTVVYFVLTQILGMPDVPVYDGKEVTLIVPNSPAGMMSRYAQTLAPHIAKNLGASNVRIDNQPGAGGLKGTNVLWKTDADGMTMAFTNVPTLLIAQLAESPGVQFNATGFVYLGRAASDPRLVLVSGTSKTNTIDDVRNLGRPFVFASQGTDEDFYTMVVLADTLGYELKIVTGYEGAADTALAIIKGDADGQMTGWPGSAAAIASGEMRPVAFATKDRQDVAPEVPTVFEYLKDETKKKQLEAIGSILALSRGFFGPPNMDPAAVEEMRTAIEKTLTDPAVVEELRSKGMPIVFLHGSKQQELVNEVFGAAGDLTPVFKKALAQIQ